MKEVLAVSENTKGYAAEYRVLSIRTSEEVRAQLDFLAELNDRSVTVEARIAIEQWVERSKSDPEVLKRVEAGQAKAEREAETKRNAIAAFLGKSQEPAGGSAKASSRNTKQAPSDA